MNRIIRYLIMLCILCIPGGYKRALFLKNRKYFKAIGEHCYLQPWNFGTEPYLISFGNNVHIASGVKFINHDITCFLFSYIDKKKYNGRVGEIIIGDNVFIGANSTVLYDVTIGNNVIIGAGSVVCSNIPEGTVAAGVPCRVIGSFEDYKHKIATL